MAWCGRPGREVFRCSHVESALLSLSQGQSWWLGLDIGHQPCAESIKCSLLWFNEAQGVPVLGTLGQDWYRRRDVVSGCSCLPRAEKGSWFRSIRRLVSSARSGTAAHPQCPGLQSCGLGWGDEENLPKVNYKILFTLFLSCPLLTGQLSTIYHFSMGRNFMFERQNGFWSVFYSLLK